MNDIETKLQKLPVETAPETLDRRVEETLQAYHNGSGGTSSMRISLWACVAASIVFFAGGVLLSPRDAPISYADTPPAQIECTIEGSPEFAAVFAAESSLDDFFLRKKKQIKPIQIIK